MGLRIVQVDAFTDSPFAGNPAAVCVLPAPRETQWMQHVAREMNLSETAFLYQRPDGFDLRWFTPAMEVPLCGHATLASAHVLWEDGHLPAGTPARFHTRSGLLTATHQVTWISLDFPLLPIEPVPAPEALVQALQVTPLYVGESRASGARYLVEVASEAIVRALQPDFALLKTLPVQGAIVTSRATSAGFGPFWRQRLNQDTFVAYQASARGGVVRVQVQKDRVILSGQAVTVLRGEILD